MDKLADKSVKEHINQIREFISIANGLEITNADDNKLEIYQKTDGKVLTLAPKQIEEIIVREDSAKQAFLQVNFLNGKKILLTEKLIGFKPAQTLNLDMAKLPKVVTTPDLISVVEAIEDSLGDENSHPEELKVLERVFDAVLRGAEDIGFSLPNEKTWIKVLTNKKVRHSA